MKIWTSRVDSVGTETGKLLNNLESGGKDDDDDGDNSDNPDGDPSQGKRRKANRGTGVTLAKDASQLKNKKPDLEFAVDPLFKKTKEDFDEGGAGGLLMNHLALGIGSEGCMRVIFDASDPMGKVEDEDVIEEPEDEINISYLRRTFFLIMIFFYSFIHHFFRYFLPRSFRSRGQSNLPFAGRLQIFKGRIHRRRHHLLPRQHQTPDQCRR